MDLSDGVAGAASGAYELFQSVVADGVQSRIDVVGQNGRRSGECCLLSRVIVESQA